MAARPQMITAWKATSSKHAMHTARRRRSTTASVMVMTATTLDAYMYHGVARSVAEANEATEKAAQTAAR